MWKTLYDPSMSWLDKKIVSIQWQYANIKRLIVLHNSVIGGLKRWWYLRQLCKKANKRLLRIAKEMQNNGIDKD